MSPTSDDDSSTGATDSDALASAQPSAVPETYANCGRAFAGEYCPACGQRAGAGLSVVSILGGFARELLNTERGLWRTFRDLTLRPGTTVQRYLQGERRSFTSPGRYLLVGAIVTTVVSATLQGIGVAGSNIGRLAINAARLH